MRRYRMVHDQALTRFLIRNFPPGSFRTNVRLGPLPERAYRADIKPEERNLYRVYCPRVDAIVFLPDKTLLIEYATYNNPQKVFQVLNNVEAFLKDPDYALYRNKPVVPCIVVPRTNFYLEELCRKWGVQLFVDTQEDVLKYLQTLRPRYREGHFSAFKGPEQSKSGA